MKRTKLIRLTSSLTLLGILSVSTVACSNKSENNTSSKSSTQSSSNTKSKTEKAVNKTKTKVKTSQINISQTKALNIFDKDYNDKKIKDIDLKVENGNYVYEIEGFDSTKEYTMTIDANSGKIINKHSETLDLDEHLKQGLNFDKVISRDEASKLAENHVKNSTSTEWKLEQDNNNAYWEVKVDDGHQKTEVKIDAQNKKIIDTEHDDD